MKYFSGLNCPGKILLQYKCLPGKLAKFSLGFCYVLKHVYAFTF